MADTHKYVGNHPQELQVGNTVVMLESGQNVTLSKDDASLEVTRDMIDSGVLMTLTSGAKGGEE